MKGKRVVIIGAYTALLIGGQLALSGVPGVEAVTVLFAAFAFAFGVADGVVLAIAFSLLRCILFGFFPNVVILYLLYYPAFALGFGLLGRAFQRGYSVKWHALAVFLALLFTALFTALDNVITPLYYGYSKALFRLYHAASVPTLLSQLICAGVSVALLFPPLVKVLSRFRESTGQKEGKAK